MILPKKKNKRRMKYNMNQNQKISELKATVEKIVLMNKLPIEA
jgi:hypothetical protein